MGFPKWLSGKESTSQAGDVGSILGQKDPLEKEMANPSFLAWEIPWKRSLMGYSPWGHKEFRHDLVTKQQ